ncbi:hypothetical protein H0X48_04620, partial [Candidatus Dependentiae bacterium]|nr:hypothetical protein [Candidatus Dependentiae bacterium]
PKHLVHHKCITEAQVIQRLADRFMEKKNNKSLNSCTAKEKDKTFTSVYKDRINRIDYLVDLQTRFKRRPNYKLSVEQYKDAMNDIDDTLFEHVHSDGEEFFELITTLIKAVDSTLPEIRAFNHSLLISMIDQNKVPVVKHLLEAGIACTLLHLNHAVSYKNFEMVSCLLNYNNEVIPQYLARNKLVIEAQKRLTVVAKSSQIKNDVSLTQVKDHECQNSSEDIKQDIVYLNQPDEEGRLRALRSALNNNPGYKLDDKAYKQALRDIEIAVINDRRLARDRDFDTLIAEIVKAGDATLPEVRVYNTKFLWFIIRNHKTDILKFLLELDTVAPSTCYSWAVDNNNLEAIGYLFNHCVAIPYHLVHHALIDKAQRQRNICKNNQIKENNCQKIDEGIKQNTVYLKVINGKPNPESRLEALRTRLNQNPQCRLDAKEYEQAYNDTDKALLNRKILDNDFHEQFFNDTDKALLKRKYADYDSDFDSLIVDIIKAGDTTLSKVCSINTQFLRSAIDAQRLGIIKAVLEVGTDCPREHLLFAAKESKDPEIVDCLHRACGINVITESQYRQSILDKYNEKLNDRALSNPTGNYRDDERKDSAYPKLVNDTEKAKGQESLHSAAVRDDNVESKNHLTKIKAVLGRSSKQKLSFNDYMRAIKYLVEQKDETDEYKDGAADFITKLLQAVDGTLPAVHSLNAQLLSSAINSKKIYLVKPMLEAGANCNIQHHIWGLPLECAVKAGDLKLVCYLLVYDAVIPPHLASNEYVIQAQKVLTKIISTNKYVALYYITNLSKKTTKARPISATECRAKESMKRKLIIDVEKALS